MLDGKTPVHFANGLNPPSRGSGKPKGERPSGASSQIISPSSPPSQSFCRVRVHNKPMKPSIPSQTEPPCNTLPRSFPPSKNDFLFERRLSEHVGEIVLEYSAQKPTLVFCR